MSLRIHWKQTFKLLTFNIINFEILELFPIGGWIPFGGIRLHF